MQFLDLNARIGGFDNDGNVSESRSEGDLAAIRAAYRTGRLTSGGGGLASTPIIDYRNYLDDDKDGNVHLRYHSFSLRERLVKANGRADNHVIFVEDQRGGGSASRYVSACAEVDGYEAFGETRTIRRAQRYARQAVGSVTPAGPGRDLRRLREADARPSSRLRNLSEASFPREIAGGSVPAKSSSALKPISGLTIAWSHFGEMARLKRMFSGGVCIGEAGVEQQKPSVNAQDRRREPDATRHEFCRETIRTIRDRDN